jgi:hypothetical protein
MSNNTSAQYEYNAKHKIERQEDATIRCPHCKLFFTRLGLVRHNSRCRVRNSWNPTNLIRLA